ncbi:Glutamyl/glutaminyl-tRNA synthetase, class Ic, catalytic domain [Solidesulfovibrio fructosivorans JJ]]|uniref:Glutamyl/glutaminyl-tRNA synthetase, class Ic, catalytic domain n=1 Tax=Solidesulfovibrio fructosivorans JJ] TaxID=596151 RepID=E1JQW9_SOLFR|nr:tRNA glutamyl-Q(34) synthetase GluQRS [Solidesulfovibrio fructosivorans]EFL52970.1 Glutamyl/glutaminyl-tRNA synthetase, class Ic, catalytic domain [Solidesulfovibrio fructosivorans JJ]]
MTVTRFAPSPTGFLHLGHAFSALTAFCAAREAGGRFLLRIEDIDPVRCKPAYTQKMLEDLHWLGLTWEEPVRVQSAHMAEYAAALGHLRARGLIYPCFCTRREIGELAAPQENDDVGPIYPGTCRNLSESERAARVRTHPCVWRLDMARACAQAGELTWHDAARGEIRAAPARFGDVVLARKDVLTSYHLSVTVDDALQGVTLVTRGQDLFAATDIHRLLQALLDLPTPRYRHHPLLRDATGRRYAKRDKSLTLRALREAGKTPAEVRAMAGCDTISR